MCGRLGRWLCQTLRPHGGYSSAWLERLVVVQEVGGSSPLSHPTVAFRSSSASSSMAEQRTLNPQVLGSNPRGRTQIDAGQSLFLSLGRWFAPDHPAKIPPIAIVAPSCVAACANCNRDGGRSACPSRPTRSPVPVGSAASPSGAPSARRWANDSKPYRPDKATVTFCALRDEVGLGHGRLHDLRHFVATQMIGAGHDIRTVASRLGHAQPSTKLNIYSAFLRDRDRAAADDSAPFSTGKTAGLLDG